MQCETIIRQATGDKYERPGIYKILLQNQLVYIGKSKKMLDRIIAHMYHIDHPEKTNKYIQLRRARDAGIKIQFDVACYCEEEELDYYEGKLIRQYMPPLNYQIPRESGKGWEVQKSAKTITYEEIMRNGQNG